MIRRLLACAVAAVAAALPSRAQEPLTDEKLRTLLQERIDANRGVGIVVGILEAGGRRIVAAGTRDREGGGPVDGDTIFEIGSLTKVFTAALLADMARRGEVRLDDPVAKVLPASVKLPKVAGHDITLRELATHTAGIPRIPADMKPADPANPYADYSVEKLYAYLGTLPDATGPLPASESYSNTGVGLLGHALALRAGKDYESLLRERILAPLGMRSTAIRLDDALRARFATPHQASLTRATAWDLPTFAGAGALRSTANDLLAFAEANLALTDDEALTWVVRRDVIWHNGATGGSVSFLGIDRAKRRAVVVLGNSQNAVQDIGMHLLDPSQRLQPVKRQPAPPKEIRLENPAAFDAFVGTYRITPQFAIDVTREGARYFVQATNQPRLEIAPSAGDTFFIRIVAASIRFVREDGRVTHLLLDQDGRVQRAERVTPQEPRRPSPAAGAP